MARLLRLEFDGAVYHVPSWDNARKDIFDDDGDRKAFREMGKSFIVSTGCPTPTA